MRNPAQALEVARLRVAPGETGSNACVGQYGHDIAAVYKRGCYFIKLNVHDRVFWHASAKVVKRANVSLFATKEAALKAVPECRRVLELVKQASWAAVEVDYLDDEADHEVARAGVFLASAQPSASARRTCPGAGCSAASARRASISASTSRRPTPRSRTPRSRMAPPRSKPPRLARPQTQHRPAPVADVAAIGGGG